MKGQIIGLLSGLVLVIIFNYSLVLNITKPLGLVYVDASHVYFILNHLVNTFLSGNPANLFTLPMFGGINNSLLFTDHHIFIGAVILPLFLITQDIVLSTNLFMLLTIFLSFFSMYLLCFYFTKKIIPSIVAATVYSFNPYVYYWFPNYLLLFSLQWIPLIFLYFEKSLKKPTSKNCFLFFLFLTLQLIGSSLYYSAFLTVILPIYTIIRLNQEKLPAIKILNRGTAIGMLLFLSVTCIDAYPYVAYFSKEPINRDAYAIEYYYSPWLANWFFTSPRNLVYGDMKYKIVKSLPDLFAKSDEEQSLFWGLTPIIIFLSSFLILKNPNHKKLWKISLLLLIICFLLSFGPKIHVSDNLTIIGPYSLIRKINPLFQFIRVPARFALFVFFFLSIIISLTTEQIDSKISSRKILYSGIIILLIFFEYWNRPAEFVNIPNDTKEFYKYLETRKNIKEILDLPIGSKLLENSQQTRSEFLDAHYLLWATLLHHKKLFNGYSSFIPAEFANRAILIAADFPDNVKLMMLRNWNVDAIILHKDEYKSTDEYERVKGSLIQLGVPLIRSTYNLDLFDLTKRTQSP